MYKLRINATEADTGRYNSVRFELKQEARVYIRMSILSSRNYLKIEHKIEFNLIYLCISFKYVYT